MKNPIFILILIVLSVVALWFLQTGPVKLFSRASSVSDMGIKKEMKSCGEPCGNMKDIVGVCKSGLVCDDSVGVCIPDPDNGGIVGNYEYGCSN